MKKGFLLTSFLVSSLHFISAQKKSATADITANIGTYAVFMKPAGSNILGRHLQPFYGFGVQAHLMTPLKLGLGASYSYMISNVKYGQEPAAFNQGSPRMSQADVYIVYALPLAESITAEPFAGGSFYRLTTRPEQNKSTYAVNMAGFTGGITFLHPIDREEQQSLFVTPKINVMFPPSADKHPFSLVQRETVLLSISAGYRYQF